MTGLSEAGEKTLSGRTLNCPNCGAALEIKLETTQSIVCHQCKAVVDVSQGIGGDLAHYTQDHGMEPLIPLGTGRHDRPRRQARAAVAGGRLRRALRGAGKRRDEQTFWREYLLFHRIEGFAFIVDAEDGWSWAIPITGAPQVSGDNARYGEVSYRKLYDYTGQITYVLGEFYWRLTRGQRTANTDYAGTGKASEKRLNRERTEGEGTQEVVWSAGEALAPTRSSPRSARRRQARRVQRDAAPASLGQASKLAKIIFWGFLLFVVLLLFRCGDDHGKQDCSQVLSTFGEASQEYQSCLTSRRSSGGYRTGGGSFGGFSSGGGHK
jgi:hypothetical protein